MNDQDSGMTVAGILKKRLFFSRTLLRRVKREKQVFLNGMPVFLNHKAVSGDVIEVNTEIGRSSSIIPQDIKLDILFEDPAFIVLNKPAGMLVHPVGKEVKGTLANGVIGHWQIHGKENPVFRPVFRIDRDTSGIVVASANHWAHLALTRQITEKTMKRYYLALVEGILKTRRGTISTGISRKEGSIIERQISASGRPSVTHYTVIKYLPNINATLLEISLETGRTHQIRVHMSSIGHPLLGDSLYGGSDRYIKRQALHLHRVILKHPVDWHTKDFTSHVPEDMKSLFAQG